MVYWMFQIKNKTKQSKRTSREENGKEETIHVKLWLKPEATKSRKCTQVQKPELWHSYNFGGGGGLCILLAAEVKN